MFGRLYRWYWELYYGYNIETFKNEDITSGNYLIIGKEGSGKTSVVISLIEPKGHMEGRIYCHSHNTELYTKNFPHKYIHTSIDIDYIYIYLKNLSLKTRYIVMDDFYTKLNECYSCFRYSKIYNKAVFATIQMPNGLRKEMRELVDYVFITKTDDMDYMDYINSIYELYIKQRENKTSDYEEFIRLYKKYVIACDYNCLVYDKLNSKFYKYKYKL